MFKCKVCAEKDARISDLKSEVASLQLKLSIEQEQHKAALADHRSDLKALVIPPQYSEHSVEALEADGILNAQQYSIEIPSTSDRAASSSDEEIAERDRILAGTY